MKFLDKVKDSVKKISHSSAEAAREGVEKISEKATEYSKLSKIKIDIKSTENKLDESLTELGKEVYRLYSSKKLKTPSEDLKPFAEKVQTISSKLETQNEELQNIYKEYASHSIDKDKVKILKKELEEGGGTIEHISIDEDSPFLGKKLKNVKLPKEVLVGTILRGDQVIIPDGTYSFKKDDKVALLGKKEDVDETIRLIAPPKEEE